MPYSNNGGPWGGGGDNKGGGRGPWDGGDKGDRGGDKGNRPGGQPPVPDIDEIVRKGQEQLKILMGGGRTGGGRGGGKEGRLAGAVEIVHAK